MKVPSGQNVLILLSLYMLVNSATGNSHNYAKATTTTSVDYTKTSSTSDDAILTNKALSDDVHRQSDNVKDEFMDNSRSTMPSSSVSTKSHDIANNISSGTDNDSSSSGGSISSGSGGGRDGKLISLDLAGEVHTHIVSPHPDGDSSVRTDHPNNYMTKDGRTSSTTPLFYWKGKTTKQDMGVHNHHLGKVVAGKRSLLPNVYIGSRYDFKRVWWGATRLMTTFSWGNDRLVNEKGRFPSIVSMFKGEVGTLHPNDYSFQAGIKIPTRRINNQAHGRRRYDGDASVITDMDSMVSIQYNTMDRGMMTMMGQGHSAIVAARLCLHNRFAVMVKGIITRFGEGAFDRQEEMKHAGFEYFQHRIPQQQVQWSEGSWLPDVKMNAGGKVVANSAIGLRNRYYQPLDDKNRAYVRLMASRQLNWNLLGMLQQGSGFTSGSDDTEYDNNTVLRFEIGAALRDGTFTSVASEAIIENLLGTFRCTLTQEQIFVLE
mmetsp:Transcript_10292/g.19272  ORF Transcript_10292/g.19272 Transcript_10292/m.19272 type:complete len:488 (+) Transcript_10292:314-1777(+)|eukprot:CAMPEP_0176482318 /NCGR_PEP_ID=MMETSP0200_2-20121128/3309_1 /TAXON_ID=947934 /ORGANISM="Chaetoceros sp., Strain GSL56" /LENGTH=487 /DNA_ID=CAMNT_0017878621 /DNA_START=624 /DNA_END=2087 /DNA_ORIENTATION=-